MTGSVQHEAIFADSIRENMILLFTLQSLVGCTIGGSTFELYIDLRHEEPA